MKIQCALLAVLLLSASAEAAQCTHEEVQELAAPAPAVEDAFGAAVAVQGDTAVVGASGDTTTPGCHEGRAHVYARTTGGGWVHVKELDGDSTRCDDFGVAVALDGDTLAVGAFEGSGAVYVYERDLGGPGNWGLSQKIPAPLNQSGPSSGFGAALALQGDVLAVGFAYKHVSGQTATGAVHVYERQSGAVPWVEQHELSGTGISLGSYFGSSLALDGERLVVGAPGPGSAQSTRRAFVFEYDPAAKTWSETAHLQTALAWTNPHGFGSEVAVDGDTVLVADERFVNNGAVWVYQLDPNTGSWTEVTRIDHPNPLPEDEFGSSVALRGDLALVGAAGHDTVSTFWRDQGGPDAWGELPGTELKGAATAPGDQFGYSLALDGITVLVGARNRSQQGLGQAGGVHVFEGSGTPPPSTYCTAKVNSAGCTPTIGYAGTMPSASTPSGFLVTCTNTLDNKSGLFFYGYASKASSYQGGWLCVQAPVRRTALQNSGGTPPCDGAFGYDLNALIASGADPALVPGATVYGQYWSRDPQSSFTTNRSDAIRLTICP